MGSGAFGLGFEVRELPDEESGAGGALACLDRAARHRGAFGGGEHEGAEHIAQRVQALPLCAPAGHWQGAVRVAGRGRSSGNHESPAGIQQQIPRHSGAGPIHRRTAEDAQDKRGGDCAGVIPEQGVGEHAAGTDRGDERKGAGGDLQRTISDLPLHVHASAVHAHERGKEAGDRGLRRGGEREEAECAGDRTAGAWILPGAGVVAGGDSKRPCRAAARVDETSARGSRRLQRIRRRPIERSRDHAEVHAAGDGQERRPAAEDAGLSCAGESVDGGDFEQGTCFFRDAEEAP
jgi:hypothetical protein